MASTYSSTLNLELQTTGENSGTWGTITNNNIQKLESAIKGYVAVAIVSTSDKVKFLFIKNTSTADGIVICLDGGVAAYNLADGIFIGPSQSWFGRLPNVTVANIHAISSDVGDAGDATANAIVAALIDDVV